MYLKYQTSKVKPSFLAIDLRILDDTVEAMKNSFDLSSCVKYKTEVYIIII